MTSNASRRRQGLAALACAVAVTLTAGAGANGGKFYSDDPITRIVDAEDASAVQRREIDLEYDTLENLFSWPGDQTPNVRAQNLNTIDEVPDSTWFTNRLGTVPITVDELVKGPGAGTGPAPVFNYHRFWAQADVAMAMADYDRDGWLDVAKREALRREWNRPNLLPLGLILLVLIVSAVPAVVRGS